MAADRTAAEWAQGLCPVLAKPHARYHFDCRCDAIERALLAYGEQERRKGLEDAEAVMQDIEKRVSNPGARFSVATTAIHAQMKDAGRGGQVR